MREEWKFIPEFSNWYEVSNLGRIRTYRTKSRGNKRADKPTLLKCYTNPIGYTYVKLKKDGQRKGYTLHRLIGISFLDNKDNKPCINHKNGIKNDNRVENIEWVTYSENTHHAIDTGLQTVLRGDNCSHSLLTSNDVLQIRSVYENGWCSRKELADAYNVSTRHISRLINKKRWCHI